MTNIERLQKYGAEEIKGYTLINNYGYTFKIDGIKYDIRFWANCYGAEINRWQIHPCTEGEGGMIMMPKELREKIEAEFNEEVTV